MNLPKTLKSYNLKNLETSYANAVLQVFIHLSSVQNWMNSLINSNEINNSFYETSITKELTLQFKNILNGVNPDTSKIIQNFDKISQNMFKKNIPQDPFHFLHYFLNILHCENNCPKNTNFNKTLYHTKIKENICSDINMFNLFNDYMDQTQNSFIFQCFNNMIKYVVNCPFCLVMYNYGEKKIIQFNMDELLSKKKELDPNNNKTMSLGDCFRYSNKMKKNTCQMCHKNSALEFKQIYNSSKDLIIAFNRNNHNPNYKNDINFYAELDVSQFIINQNCENKKYKLKGVICQYDKNKYFSDVLINSNFYRFMDCLQGIDVKIIKNTNELISYEPQILFYEVDYQSNMSGKIQDNMNMRQSVSNMGDLTSTMKINLDLINNFPKGLDAYKIVNYFPLKFLVIPELWDHNEENAITINVQVSENFTFEETIKRFFIQLKKPKEAINHFYINNIQLDRNSHQKLKDMNINEKSIIHAIKKSNFDYFAITYN